MINLGNQNMLSGAEKDKRDGGSCPTWQVWPVSNQMIKMFKSAQETEKEWRVCVYGNRIEKENLDFISFFLARGDAIFCSFFFGMSVTSPETKTEKRFVLIVSNF
jgi:hypothetical protein